MGSSFTSYQGRGFWTRDSKLELWLHLLSEEAKSRQNEAEWLQQARDLWHEQATVGFTGCVYAGLDELVGDDEARLSLLREVSAGARLRLLRHGEGVPLEVLNDARLGGGAEWAMDLPTAEVLAVADAFDRLLTGDLDWTASTSPML